MIASTWTVSSPSYSCQWRCLGGCKDENGEGTDSGSGSGGVDIGPM
jgi:hypothetical protein